MKQIARASVIVLMLLSLSACDTGKENAPAPPAPNGEPAADASPSPPPFNPAYEEHMIMDERYYTVREFAYTSPIDGKRLICTSYGTGVGDGVSCRVAS